MKKKPQYTRRFAFMMTEKMREKLTKLAEKLEEHEAEVVRRALEKYLLEQ